MDWKAKAIELVYEYTKSHIDKTDKVEFKKDNVFIVWFCKTLQNAKCLVATNLPVGMYYEVTFDGDKEKIYLDAYKKFENVQHEWDD